MVFPEESEGDAADDAFVIGMWGEDHDNWGVVGDWGVTGNGDVAEREVFSVADNVFESGSELVIWVWIHRGWVYEWEVQGH